MPDSKRRWRAKDTRLSDWRELPGLHTRVQIWKMKQEGRIALAEPIKEAGKGDHGADKRLADK